MFCAPGRGGEQLAVLDVGLLAVVNSVGDVDDEEAIADVEVPDCCCCGCCGRRLSGLVPFKLRSTLSIELILSVLGFIDDDGALDVPALNVGD